MSLAHHRETINVLGKGLPVYTIAPICRTDEAPFRESFMPSTTLALRV
jgi:hypothetical protein